MRISAISVIAAALFLTTTPSHAQTYNVTDLGATGGIGSRVYDINNVGQVVGYISPGYGASRAAIWNGTTVTDLGTAGGTDSIAYSVNDSGYVVGTSSNATNSAELKGVVWKGTSVTTLGYGAAYGINNSDQIVGMYLHPASGAGGFMDATLWDGESTTNLGALAGTHCCWYFIGSQAYSINNYGVIAGVSDGSATVWNGTSVTDLVAIDQSADSAALSINDSGLVVGTSSFDDTIRRHATLWTSAGVIDLGTLDGLSAEAHHSSAYDINNAGPIVGVSNTPLGDTHAVLWDSYGVAIDLNTLIDPALALYVTLFEARAINDNGLIAANGIDSRTGAIHGYVLTPVPLPASLWLLIGGLGLVFRRK